MQETVAAGAPSSSPMKKPSGSAAAKQASSAKPGFQPSAAAQFTAIEISSGRIGRMRKPFMAYGTSVSAPCYRIRYDLQQRCRWDRDLSDKRPIMRGDQQHRGGYAGRKQPHRNQR